MTMSQRFVGIGWTETIMRLASLGLLCGLATGAVINIEDAGAKDGDDRYGQILSSSARMS
jgi:hypothetical protein